MSNTCITKIKESQTAYLLVRYSRQCNVIRFAYLALVATISELELSLLIRELLYQ